MIMRVHDPEPLIFAAWLDAFQRRIGVKRKAEETDDKEESQSSESKTIEVKRGR